jgi:PTH1 family peptidyl-tRNA hydrolase
LDWIFIGLGNPGASFASHRHNVGFWALDRIHDAGTFDTKIDKKTMAIATGTFHQWTIGLCWPLTYMNSSGPAALPFIKKYPKANHLVFHDEMDMACGAIGLKEGGSPRGHNGVKSLHTILGPDYPRIRIGVGRPEHRSQVNQHVLSGFPPTDKKAVTCAIDHCIAALPLLLAEDIQTFQAALKQPHRP